MSKYMKYGEIVLINSKMGEECDKIPTGVYKIAFSQPIGFHLKLSSLGSTPSKLYGEVSYRRDRVFDTFKSRASRKVNTGVMLSGEKGSGKTLLAKTISDRGIKEDVPTIIVDSSYDGSTDMVNFLASISQPCIILLDEFDKTFSKKEEQEVLLTLIDGMSEASKLFIFTRNNGFLSEFFVNRPSRVFYSFNYDKISLESLLGYIEDNLDNPSHVDSFKSLHDVATQLSFDVIQGLVEELNRYPRTTFKECLDLMGVELNQVEYMVDKLFVNGEVKQVTYFGGLNLHKFLSGQQTAYMNYQTKPDESDDDEGVVKVVGGNGATSVVSGDVVYKKDDIEIVFKQKPISNKFISNYLV